MSDERCPHCGQPKQAQVAGAVFGILAGFTIWSLIAIAMTTPTRKWQREAAEHGCGEYDRRTGEWVWVQHVKGERQ